MKKIFINTTLFTLFCLSSQHMFGAVNPSARYCEILGYEYVIEKDSTGGEIGLCVLPDGSKVDAWDFYYGKVKPEYSYCSKYGYESARGYYEKDGVSFECQYCNSKTALKGGSYPNSIPVEELIKKNGEAQGYSLYEEEEAENTLRAAKTTSPVTIVSNLPEVYDSRERDIIGGAKNQGSCGSCYSFASSACTEMAYNRFSGTHGTDKKVLSESFMIWCLSNYYFQGCSGASISAFNNDNKCLQTVTEKGLCESAYFPYVTSNPQTCTHWNDPNVKVSNYGAINYATNDQIKSAIYRYGAAYALVNGSSIQGYSSGILKISGNYTHAVVIVGWGKNGSRNYWIVRNSWGSNWGINGYFYVDMDYNTHLNRYISYLIPTEVSLDADNINERNQVPAEGNTKFYGRNSVKLRSGFKVNKGGKFKVTITHKAAQPSTSIYATIGNSSDMIIKGIEEEEAETNSTILLSPNPTTGEFTIFFGDESEEGNSVVITDLAGKAVYSAEGLGSEVSINLSDKTKGVYIVKAITNGNIRTEKLILK